MCASSTARRTHLEKSPPWPQRIFAAPSPCSHHAASWCGRWPGMPLSPERIALACFSSPAAFSRSAWIRPLSAVIFCFSEAACLWWAAWWAACLRWWTTCPAFSDAFAAAADFFAADAAVAACFSSPASCFSSTAASCASLCAWARSRAFSAACAADMTWAGAAFAAGALAWAFAPGLVPPLAALLPPPEVPNWPPVADPPGTRRRRAHAKPRHRRRQRRSGRARLAGLRQEVLDRLRARRRADPARLQLGQVHRVHRRDSRLVHVTRLHQRQQGLRADEGRLAAFHLAVLQRRDVAGVIPEAVAGGHVRDRAERAARAAPVRAPPQVRKLGHAFLVAAAGPAQGLEADQDAGDLARRQDPLRAHRRHAAEIHLRQRVADQRDVGALVQDEALARVVRAAVPGVHPLPDRVDRGRLEFLRVLDVDVRAGVVLQVGDLVLVYLVVPGAT